MLFSREFPAIDPEDQNNACHLWPRLFLEIVREAALPVANCRGRRRRPENRCLLPSEAAGCGGT